jgi:hypothetical protein
VTGPRRPPRRCLAGLALLGAAWAAGWSGLGPPLVRGGLFFALWLGYILLVDGLVGWRTGSSPWQRDRAAWLLLFAVSAPIWWLFEFLNLFLANWRYLGAEAYGPLGYAFFATLSFSTVVPAVMTTAELVASLAPARALARGPRLELSPRVLTGCIALGLVGLGGVAAAPRYFYPVTWLALILVLDPVNHLAGRPSLAARLGRGDWRLVAWLALGALACGVCWELWNVRWWPKWVYDVPFLGFGKVFEMPILGYLGYLPFGLELYALYTFLVGLAARSDRWWLVWDRAEAAPPGPAPRIFAGVPRV